MKVPEIRKCPGCGIDPAPVRDGQKKLGLWCEACGFNFSLADGMHAEYLIRFHSGINIETAAYRMKHRLPLLHSLAKVA